MSGSNPQTPNEVALKELAAIVLSHTNTAGLSNKVLPALLAWHHRESAKEREAHTVAVLEELGMNYFDGQDYSGGAILEAITAAIKAQATEQGINQKLTPIDKAQGGISE